MIPFPIRSKSFFLEQSCYERSQTIVAASLYCLLFLASKKQWPKTDFEKYYQCSVSTDISLDVKICFSLLTYRINKLIALRSTNQITEISAPWWLISNAVEMKWLISIWNETLSWTELRPSLTKCSSMIPQRHMSVTIS